MHSSLGCSNWLMSACDINRSQQPEFQDLFWKFGGEYVSSLISMYDNDVECENSANIFTLQCEEGTIRINWAQGRGKNITQKKPGPQCHDALLDQTYLQETMSLDLVTAGKSHFHFYLCQFNFYVPLNQKQTYISQHLGCRITVWKRILRSASWQAVVLEEFVTIIVWVTKIWVSI